MIALFLHHCGWICSLSFHLWAVGGSRKNLWINCTIRVLLVVSAKQVFFFFCRLLYMFCVHNLFYWNIYLKMPGWVTNTVFASCNDPNKASNFCRTWENVLTFSHCWFQSFCMWETKLTPYRIRNQFQVQFPIKKWINFSFKMTL